MIRVKYFETDEEEYKHQNKTLMGNCVRCKMYNVLDPHHQQKRRYDTNNETIVHLCRKCHNFVEQNPARAKEEGYYIRKHTVDGYENNKKRDFRSLREQGRLS